MRQRNAMKCRVAPHFRVNTVETVNSKITVELDESQKYFHASDMQGKYNFVFVPD